MCGLAVIELSAAALAGAAAPAVAAPGWLSPTEWETLWLSAKVGAACTLLCLPLAIACGWLLARRQFWGKTALDTLVHLPLILPPVVIGHLLLVIFGRRGPVGSVLHSLWGLDVALTWRAAVLASAVVGFPLLVHAVRLSFEQVEREYELAASVEGANAWQVFVSVTLPLAWPGVLAGLVLCFARSLGEFGATITFAGNIAGESRTLPLAIYSSMQTPDASAMVWRLSAFSTVVAVVALYTWEWLARRARQRLA